MNGHLISVEVSVESGANHRMDLDGFSFNENRLESLDAQAVQGWGAVQKDEVMLDDLVEDLIGFFRFKLNHFSCRSHVVGIFFFDQLVDDERFEKFKRHFFRQTALVQFQFRSDNDHAAAGIVHPLSKKVLTETALFPFEHICE